MVRNLSDFFPKEKSGKSEKLWTIDAVGFAKREAWTLLNNFRNSTVDILGCVVLFFLKDKVLIVEVNRVRLSTGDALEFT